MKKSITTKYLVDEFYKQEHVLLTLCTRMNDSAFACNLGILQSLCRMLIHADYAFPLLDGTYQDPLSRYESIEEKCKKTRTTIKNLKRKEF